MWLNGAFIGSDSSGNQQTKMFTFPSCRRYDRAADNVVAVLVQSSSHDEDGVYGNPPSDSQKSPRGLMGAKLNGASEEDRNLAPARATRAASSCRIRPGDR